jgi:hypothetical protein
MQSDELTAEELRKHAELLERLKAEEAREHAEFLEWFKTGADVQADDDGDATTLVELEDRIAKRNVATVLDNQVTHGELWAALLKVAPRNDWKNPIDCCVDLNDFEMAMVRRAVIYFTASVPTIEPQVGATAPRRRYRVRAAGYWASQSI